MLLSLIKNAFVSSWKGKIGIIYPIILRFMAGILRLGMLFMVCALILSVSQYSPDAATFTKWFVVLGMPLFFWWLLSASCRLMWWHELEKGSEECQNSRNWLTDLPPMLCLDFVFAGIKSICIAAVVLGVVGMASGSFLAVLTTSVGALLLFLSTVIQPLVIAERVVSGDSLIQSVINAISDIRKWPAMTLIIRFLPELVAAALYMSGFALGMFGNTLLLCVLSVAGWLISMMKPVFWTELVHLANRRVANSTVEAPSPVEPATPFDVVSPVSE